MLARLPCIHHVPWKGEGTWEGGQTKHRGAEAAVPDYKVVVALFDRNRNIDTGRNGHEK
jgi:hypothetical protein